MAKKRVQKIPVKVKLKCPNCLQITQIDTRKVDRLSSFKCTRCEGEIRTPITQCCVICAFSDKRCPYSLKVEAHAKGLELR